MTIKFKGINFWPVYFVDRSGMGDEMFLFCRPCGEPISGEAGFFQPFELVKEDGTVVMNVPTGIFNDGFNHMWMKWHPWHYELRA